MLAHRILFAIPPYLGDKIEAIRPGKLRSFFAFPYGVLCLASYIKKATSGAHEIKIIDLNQYSVAQGLAQFAEVMADFKLDIVGISVMFDVSYNHCLPDNIDAHRLVLLDKFKKPVPVNPHIEAPGGTCEFTSVVAE